jgi:hypothetical protein
MKFNLSAVLLILLATSSQAAILTFDDIPGQAQNSYGAIGTYQGFNFGSSNSYNRLDWVDTVGSNWNYGSVSGDFTLLNNYGSSGVITAQNSSDFSFDGLWAKTWGNNAASRTAYIRGFNDGVELWSSEVTLSSQFSYYSGLNGLIDELRLDFGNYFLVDNLALTETTQSVSEPATITLFGLGLLSLVGIRRLK